MLTFLKKKAKNQTPETTSPSIQQFMRLHYGKLIGAGVIIFIALGFYFVIVGTYDTLINPAAIKESEIVSEKKKLNITQYEQTYQSLQDKQALHSDTLVPRIFR